MADLSTGRNWGVGNNNGLIFDNGVVGRLFGPDNATYGNVFRYDVPGHRDLPAIPVDLTKFVHSGETLTPYAAYVLPEGIACANSTHLVGAGGDRLIVGIFRPSPMSPCPVPSKRPILEAVAVLSATDGLVYGRTDLPPDDVLHVDPDTGHALVVCRLPAAAIIALRGAIAPQPGRAFQPQ